MKKLLLSLSIIIVAVSLIACGKDKTAGTPGNQNGTTPIDSQCAGGYQQQGQLYGNQYGNQYYGNQYYGNQYGNQYGQVPQNANCGQYGMYGNSYYQHQQGGGTCDLRFSGRGQLCPNGYTCIPAYGYMGYCAVGVF